jgi:sporulation protein YlmC with PRC-barrel domain
MDLGRMTDAGLELLDRQIVDKDGKLAGKVDDLELRFPDGGGAPYVSAILAGPGALAKRLGGWSGALFEELHHYLKPQDRRGPARIPFGVVKRVTIQIELEVAKADLGVNTFEEWVRSKVISKIPGGRRAHQ